jgi:4-alpha-glucanotransferase
VPGTIDERPNWSLPLPVPLDELAADPRVRRLAGILSNGLSRPAAEAERKS